MEKIGDYIPLIIIALSLIFTIVRKAGKKEEDTNKTTLPNGSSQEDKPFEDIIFERQVQPQSVRTAVKKKQQPDLNPAVLSSLNRNERQSSMLVEEIADNPEISLDFNDVDELKRGIIYSEIFNRKYGEKNA